MNYYFLLEDEKSLMKVLPSWLKYIDFKCTRVADIKEINNNNYVMQSGKGVTQLITKVLFDTIDTILDNPNTIDKLVILIDTEEENEEYRKQQIYEKISQKYNEKDFDFKIDIFVCNHCFESWLLGAMGLYPKTVVNLHSDFYPYYIYYDIEKFDPEKMMPPESSRDNTANYHFHYLCEVLRYNKKRYCKSRPKIAMEIEYFNSMMERINKTEHLNSFKKFIDFIKNENKIMDIQDHE